MSVMRFALALALVLVPVSGCITTDDANGNWATAQELRPTADERALAWSDDAELVTALGVELGALPAPDVYEYNDYAAALAGRTDPSVGDGRAQAWLFQYSSPSDNSTDLAVVVSANGTISAEADLDEDDGFDDDAEPITDWLIDSDEAVGIAKENNETWAEVGAKDNVFMFLRQQRASEDEPSDPWWVLGIENENGTDEAVVFVNARNGTYIELPTFRVDLDGFDAFSGPPTESGSFDARVTTLEPSNEHEFEIEHEGHPRLVVALVFDEPGPEVTINLTITDPTGETWSHTTEVATTARDAGVVGIGEPVTGDWHVQVTLEDGLARDYTLDWCAEGSGFDIEVGLLPSTEEDPCRHA